jgi:hypothetical protein
MPSVRVTLPATWTDVVKAPNTAICKIRKIKMENIGGGGARSFQLRDSYTPSETGGTATTKLLTSMIPIAINASGEQDFDEGIEFVGTLQILGSAADANCEVTIVYEVK